MNEVYVTYRFIKLSRCSGIKTISPMCGSYAVLSGHYDASSSKTWQLVELDKSTLGVRSSRYYPSPTTPLFNLSPPSRLDPAPIPHH